MYTELISLLWEITDLSARIKSLLSDYKEAGKLILKNIDRLIDKKSLSKYENDDIVVTREKVAKRKIKKKRQVYQNKNINPIIHIFVFLNNYKIEENMI